MTTRRTASYTVQLEPGGSVRRDRGRFVAEDATPWMKVRFADGTPAGRWISLTYRASYLDTLVRPILRFVAPDGPHDRMAPAPLFGRAIWTGRVPDGTNEVLISPVSETGPFGFEIESCQPLSPIGLLARAWSRNPKRTAEAVASGCIGRRREARRLLTLALGSVPLEKYHEWRTERLRGFDPEGLDAPRADWSTGPHIRIVVAGSSQEFDRVRDLLGHLDRQAYQRWSLALVSPDSSRSLPAELATRIASGHLLLIDPRRAVAALPEGISDEGLIGAINVDDSLPPYALAVLAEHAMRRPAKSFFYADEDAIDADGRYVAPRLKPDWSPAFEVAGRYVGAPLFARGRWLAQRDTPSIDMVIRDGGLNALLAGVPETEVEHVRRVMLTHPAQTRPAARAGGAPLRQDNRPPCIGATPKTGGPCVTIIIPNRDQPHLLAACMRGLGMMASPGNYEVIIVDNGSVEPGTDLLYQSLKSDDRVRVIDRPGPFNFARLCNDAAGEARASTLLFLNNDIEMIDDNWLQPLLSWASHPDVGAVGAKLLYPSGQLQHGGVVVGLAGGTAHIDRGAGKDDHGYLERRRVPHEISAVTGACLAVEKAKFDAVGGFDAEHLPVELNDIDLCLRLAERGWRTVFTPRSVLIHHESASRGTSTAQSGKYQRERALFRRRWGSRLRDDPYFHPALSLVSIRTALG